jgi:hypothetical protein
LPFKPEREPPICSTSPPRNSDSVLNRWRISSLIILAMLFLEYRRHSTYVGDNVTGSTSSRLASSTRS